VKALCAFVVGALLLTSPVNARQTADALDELFARGKTAQAGIKTLSAAFTETTVSSLLRDPVIAEGTLIAVTPVRVVMAYTSPVAKTVALDSTRLVVAWASRPQREEINIAETQRRVQTYFVEASPKELRDSFTITLSTDAASHDAYRLDMVPKRRQIAEGLDRLRIWIDPVRLLMVKMTIEYRGGDRKTFELRDLRTNVPIDESAFALLAKGR
jgi:outer membrane lipoprotein-sorting protein